MTTELTLTLLHINTYIHKYINIHCHIPAQTGDADKPWRKTTAHFDKEDLQNPIISSILQSAK